MPETLEDFLMTRPPTAERPLLGQTILAVEDSRFASDALRLICQRSGARLRRADCLAAAARHLLNYRPGIVLVDIGLPDGSGLDLVADLSRGEPRVDGVFAMSGDDTCAEAALAAGADGFLAKPIESVVSFQQRMLSVLPVGARPVTLEFAERDGVVPDRMALQDDLSRIAGLLADADDAVLTYVNGFLAGLAKGAPDEMYLDVSMQANALTEKQASDREIADLRAAVLSLIAFEDEVASPALKRG